MIKMSRKAKKAMAVALTAGMLASTAVTPVMAATQGWKQNSKGWWYQNADGSYPANKWEKINGKWYYFNANGYMLANGWAQDKAGLWYYVGADGAMKTNSWAQDKKGLWYYVGNDGAMVTNTWKQDKKGLWYRLGADGVMEAGKWITLSDKSYFLAADGVMQSGVITVEGKTYYLGASNDGAMKTGEQTIAATKYNFGADGVCTDEKAPAADKHFDAKGNEITPEIEVETVAGITAEITNALPDYQAEYGNVVIAGDNAYLKVLVTDANGKPVANTPVSIKKEHKAGNSISIFKPHSYVQPTDANGYATFVIGAYDNTNVTSTTKVNELMTITYTAVATNQSKDINLAFAYVDLGRVNVINDDKDDDALLEVPSKNAAYTDDIIGETDSTDGNSEIEYVVSQQVSDKNDTNHKVEIEVNPKIMIPYETTTSEIDEYSEVVNKEIKEYSVYEDGSNGFKIEGVPAGLKYISLDFASMDISEYSHVEIQKYYAGTDDKAGDPYFIKGATTKNNSTYQIPVQDKTTKYDIEVKIISEGQVNDDQNGGVVLTKIYGPYASKSASDVKDVDFGSVTWSAAEIKYSNDMTLDWTKADAYLPSTMDEYVNENYTYTYQVPAFPYSGNAIMTVKDENKKIVAYFTIPTENKHTELYDVDNDVNYEGNFQNENIIIDTVAGANKAVLVSYDEAFGKEGSFTQDGNKVIVNSEKTGVTALQAKISVPGFEDQINLTNDTFYTSVHWSPLPNEVVTDTDDFYALVGQDITIKAQLVDKNGNKVTQAGQDIFFKYTKETTDGTTVTTTVEPISKMGAIPGTKASASDFTSKTDANGQVEIKITSADELALVKSLYAESSKFDVQLTIGGQTVSNANLHWVDAGLSFTDRTKKVDGTVETIDTLDGTPTIDSILDGTDGYLVKDAGTNWIFGYEVVGETGDKAGFTITGLKVDVAKGGEGTLTTTGMANGTAKLTSKVTGITTLTGTVNEKSVVSGTDVEFHIGDDVFKNVGEGPASINASLNLPINWGNVGTAVSIISPKGSKLEYTTGEKAYVKVVDELGNDLNDQPVDIRVTYTLENDTTVETDVNGKKADETGVKFEQKPVKNGLVTVNLQESVGNVKVKSALIVAKVGNATPAKYTINYETVTGIVADFEIGDIVYEEQTASSNPKVRVIFTTNVNAETLKKEMFKVLDSAATPNELNIASVEMGDRQNEVIITLSNTHSAGLDYKEEYTVKVGVYTDSKTDIEYNLCDTYFRPITTNANTFKSDTFKTADTDLEAGRETATKKAEDSVADQKQAAKEQSAVAAAVEKVSGAITTANTATGEPAVLPGKVDLSGITEATVATVSSTNFLTVDGDGKVVTINTGVLISSAETFTVTVKSGSTTKTLTYSVDVTKDDGGAVTGYTITKS